MNKSKNKANNQKGITLIALVITIVVLVILVGVTVSTAINSGLIVNSKKAVSDYEAKQNQEELEIAAVEAQMDFLSSSSDVTVSTGSVETEVAGLKPATETYITGVQGVEKESVSSFETIEPQIRKPEIRRKTSTPKKPPSNKCTEDKLFEFNKSNR